MTISSTKSAVFDLINEPRPESVVGFPVILIPLTSPAFLGAADVDECSEPTSDGRPPCGVGADCINLVGSFECACPEGTSGNPYTGCTANKVQCGRDSDCGQNEKCVQPGQCVWILQATAYNLLFLRTTLLNDDLFFSVMCCVRSGW